ncbi:MAG: hypothetical protein MMC33_003692 [Icmadophila ericetorum]|nr:hypothetical protein [Icmadophila ericetorum]
MGKADNQLIEGPNEITIFNTDGMYALHNTTSIFPKAAWYDILLPEIAMSTARDKAVHDQRRRIWDHGFSIKALHLYEGRVTSYAQILESQISKRTGSGINISEWFNWYATDIMGDLAFGRSFDLLSTGKNQADVDLLKKGTPVVGLFLPTPWLFVLLAKMPGPNQEWKQLQGWCYAQLERRLKSKVDVPDIMSWLIEASEAANRLETDMHLLRGDSALIILAGSDTAGAALSSLFYHIVSEPKYLRALREELKTLPSLTDAKALESLPLLNGIVHETLRLHPPTPSGVLRNTPPGGATIGSTFVPGDVTVAVPFYSLGRSEANFVRADEFIPERWFSQPELVKDKLGYVPFSIGQYSCVGKNLALMEMRSVTALLVAKYEISFAPTQLAKQQSFELGLHDHFTSTAAGLDLVFTPLEKHVVVGA